MGKYMKKSKIAGDVAVMEVSSSPPPQSSIGVRTRAKTLALQKSSLPFDNDPSSFSYLQLRSRRLQKVVVASAAAKKHQPPSAPPKRSDFCLSAVNSKLIDEEENLEGSFGENVLELEGRDRSTRESTPCSLIRDSNTIDTPGSTTRQRTSTFTNQIIHEHMQRNIPTAYEMEEFFACAEKQQQTIFMDKYNFDIVNDVPLRGRYEWVQVHH